MIELRGEVSAVEALRTLVERHQKRFVDLMDQVSNNELHFYSAQNK